MHLQFSAKDSVYTILSTLKKAPSYKRLFLQIADDHSLFDHSRWGNQIRSVVEEHHLDLICIATTEKQKRYREQCQLAYAKDYDVRYIKTRKKICGLFVSTKDIHQKLFREKSILYVPLVIFECCMLGIIVWMLWKYITPNTYITIESQYNQESLVYNFHYSLQDTLVDNGLENILLHYSTGDVPFLEQANYSSESVTYILTPSRGEVTLYNLLPYELKLIKDTKLVSDDGIMYKLLKDVKFYASDGNNPTNVRVPVIALDYQEDGRAIGDRGNIDAGTTLYVRNLKESLQDKKVYGVTSRKFTGGSTKTQGKVVEKDIQELEKKMLKSIYQKKLRIIQERKHASDDVILGFDDLIRTLPANYKHNVQVGDANPFIEGHLDGTLQYYYVTADSLVDAVKKYLSKRESPYLLLHDIDLKSVELYDKKEVETGVYEIPTKINIIRGYNFTQDPNAIIAEIRERIKGLSFDEAKSVIYTYPDIAKVTITNSPFWFRSISDNPERIEFFLDEKK